MTFSRNYIPAGVFSEIYFSELFVKSELPGNGASICIARYHHRHLFFSSYKRISLSVFSIKLFLFTKGFHQTFLIKLSVFVRFDERYCEHSTRKDIKARFALRNTNGFRKFSPTRSYRLSWYGGRIEDLILRGFARRFSPSCVFYHRGEVLPSFGVVVGGEVSLPRLTSAIRDGRWRVRRWRMPPCRKFSGNPRES